MANTLNRFGGLAKVMLALDSAVITGICMTAVGPGIVMNFPHVHGIPSLQHDHGIRVPDIDCENYSSPQALRAAVVNAALTSNAPTKKKTSLQELIKFALGIPGFIASSALQVQKGVRFVLQYFT